MSGLQVTQGKALPKPIQIQQSATNELENVICSRHTERATDLRNYIIMLAAMITVQKDKLLKLLLTPRRFNDSSIMKERKSQTEKN